MKKKKNKIKRNYLFLLYYHCDTIHIILYIVIEKQE